MANYVPYQSNRYSLLDELPTTQYGTVENPSQGASSQEDPWIKPSTVKDAYGGMQAGGLSGALMSGGVSSMLNAGSMDAALAGGGPYAIAGGLLLSELEAAQKAKAQQEAEKIYNEKTRMANMTNLLNQNSRTVFNV